MYLKHIAILSVLALLAVAAHAQEPDSDYDPDVYSEEDAVHENVRRVDAPGLYPNAGDPNYKPTHTHTPAPNPARFEGKDPPGVYEHGVGSASGSGGHSNHGGSGRAPGGSHGGHGGGGKSGRDGMYVPPHPNRLSSQSFGIQPGVKTPGKHVSLPPDERRINDPAVGTPAVVSAPRVPTKPVHIGSGGPVSSVSVNVPGAL